MTRDRALGLVLACAAAAGLASASRAPMTAHSSEAAVLRLAWSARPERVERCRELSSEELQRTPAHMRQAVVCEGGPATYRLEVRLDGRLVAEEEVRAGGLRQDRRLYVYRDVPLPAGDPLVDVRFSRVDEDDEDDDDDDDDGDRDEEDESHADGPGRRRRAGVVPRRLALTERGRVGPRGVMLVTYDPARRALVSVQPNRTTMTPE